MNPKQIQVNGSFSTIFALLNSILGGTLLAIPLLFLQTGLINGLIIMLVAGFISWKTCSLYVIHCTPEQKDYEQSVLRLKGRRWYFFFNVITGSYLLFLNVLYVVLMNDQLYNIISFWLQKAGHIDWIAKKNQITFSKFSLQYIALITALPIYILLFVRKLDILVKISSLGVISIFTLLTFILYAFLSHVQDVDYSKLPLFTLDVGNLMGTSMLAFTIHTVVVSICKTSLYQTKNQRYLKIAYGLGTFIYNFVGIAGAIGVFTLQTKAKKSCTIQNAPTILDCFSGEWLPVIVQTLYFFQVLSLIPNFLQVTRSRLFQIFQKEEISFKQKLLFNTGFILISYSISISEKYLYPADIMAFIGCTFCFFFVFLIPIVVHMACYYKSNQQHNKHRLLTDSFESAAEDGQCNPHYDIPRRSKLSRLVFYGSFCLLGILVMVFGLIQQIQQLINRKNNE